MRILTILKDLTIILGGFGFVALIVGAITFRIVQRLRRNERILSISRLNSKNVVAIDVSLQKSYPIIHVLSQIGLTILKSGLLSQKTISELRQTTSSVKARGFNPLAVFIGAKSLCFCAGIAAAWIAFRHTIPGTFVHLLLPIAAPVVGLLLPDMIVKKIRANYLAQVDSGIADALDMLVICAEAGLPIEAAIGRVAKEMEKVNRCVANEFRITSDEMLVFTDRREVLMNFGQRTGLVSIKRIASALNQTILAGSSISQALRVLSVEMRQDMLTRYEARAAQLPVMLTLPMILFILPVVFIVAAGPAIMKLGQAFSH